MAQLIDGRMRAKEIRKTLKAEVKALVECGGRAPCLAAVLVGDDPASKVYVAAKERACKRAGIYSQTHRLASTTSENELLSLVVQLNEDPAVDGILVQLPLPGGFDVERVVETIAPSKDVDGFHPSGLGRLLRGTKTFLPCTPNGVMDLLAGTDIELEGKHAVVIGRSLIVGKPLAVLLLDRNCTVTVCHSRTRNLPAVARQADILVAAVGRPEMVTQDFVKPGAVVIDVGMNRLDDGRLVGDVKFSEVEPLASHITPVPKGVGPMTIAKLLENVVKARQSAD